MRDKISKVVESLKKAPKWLFISSIIAIVLLVLLLGLGGSSNVAIDVETSLKEIVKTADMSTAKYTYNSIAEVENDKEVECYISYKGTVTMGFDFENVEVISKGTTLYVVIPSIQVNMVDVETEMDYLFTKDKYKKEAFYETAHKACVDDLRAKANASTAMKEMAIESAISTMEALVQPFSRKLDDGREIKVVYITEVEEGKV